MGDVGKRVQLFVGTSATPYYGKVAFNKRQRSELLADGYTLGFTTRVPSDWTAEQAKDALLEAFTAGWVTPGKSMIPMIPTGTFRSSHTFPQVPALKAGEEKLASGEFSDEDSGEFSDEDPEEE